MSKNFINYHVLISHNPSCLNRDDMNMQKTAVFGGTKRVRISSQSLKRTMRKSDYYNKNIGESSIRSRHLFHPEESSLESIFVDKLKDRYDEDIIIKTLEILSGKDYSAETEVMADSVAPWAIEEVAWFCEKIKNVGRDFDAKKFSKEVKQEITALRKNLRSCVDIALSGRMATSGLMTELGKVDGALAIAHAISTHTIENDLDWFTAVDDLQALGSGHLDTQEFSSGVFYRYASLNIGQLQQNLGNASREETLKIAAHVLHMLATETPSAKQQSFAAFNLADFAMISFSDMPISLANAFEAPVKSNGKGFLHPSIEKLQEYWLKTHTGYGLDEKTAAFNMSESDLKNEIESKDSLKDLENWLINDGK